jgi:hypothetical protein
MSLQLKFIYLAGSDYLCDYFNEMDAWELQNWSVALGQLALDARNAELTRPLDLTILAIDERDNGLNKRAIPDHNCAGQ